MKDEVLALRDKGHTYKEISVALGCAISTVSYHCRDKKTSNKTPDEVIAQMQPLYDALGSCEKVAKHLGVSKPTVLRYIVTTKLTEVEKRQNSSKSVIEWRKRKKVELVAYKGGKCEACGYSKSVRALTFHHLDPNQKDFTISGKSWSFERLKQEVDKCVLLCANCHMEEHERLETEITTAS